ncbi:reverse transcriptase domain-containing protein, partial [Tanacetum coccineum]
MVSFSLLQFLYYFGNESVGSPPSRVILFGDIPTVIPSTSVVAPETSTIAPVISYAALVVETTLVASPTRLCGLVPYSDSDSDSPDEILAWRRVSPRSLDHHSSSSSSSSDSLPVHSSGLDAPDQAYSGSSTRDVSPRLESSSGDSSERPLHSSYHSAGPFCNKKRGRFCDSLVMGMDVMLEDHVEIEHPKDVGDYMTQRICMRLTPVRCWKTRFTILRTMTNTRSGMTPATIEEMINQRVDAALEARRVNQDLELGNGNDNGGGDGNGNGTGNGNNGGHNDDGNENRNVNGRGDRPVARECTYQDFMKCQPLSFKGTEGVVGLIKWSEKMETMFHISNCPERYQVKYATCTLLDSALTWWNSHKRTIRTDVAYALSWRELLKLMTEVYYPRNEIQKMETELWNLSVKNNDMATYTQRFQELIMMCTKMVPEEKDHVEKFFGGLPDNIQGNVIAIEPTGLQDAVRIANNLMDQKLKGYAVRNAENKKRLN